MHENADAGPSPAVSSVAVDHPFAAGVKCAAAAFRYDNAVKCMDGGTLTLSYLRVGIVDAGYTFNLRERELETLLQARSGNTATKVLRRDGAAG